MKTFKISIKDLTLMSIMLAILIISSKIVIPIGPISITMQTFAVIIISLILGMYKTSIIHYIRTYWAPCFCKWWWISIYIYAIIWIHNRIFI